MVSGGRQGAVRCQNAMPQSVKTIPHPYHWAPFNARWRAKLKPPHLLSRFFSAAYINGCRFAPYVWRGARWAASLTRALLPRRLGRFRPAGWPPRPARAMGDTSLRLRNRAGSSMTPGNWFFETVREEPSFEPPAEAIATGQGDSTRGRSRDVASAVVRTTAKLLFDSQLATAAAGVRALRRRPRTLLTSARTRSSSSTCWSNRRRTVPDRPHRSGHGAGRRRSRTSPACRAGVPAGAGDREIDDERIRRVFVSSSTTRATICVPWSISITRRCSSR